MGFKDFREITKDVAEFSIDIEGEEIKGVIYYADKKITCDNKKR